MKNIIIAGIPRSGKTTFAKLVLNNFPKYDIVEVDNIKVSELRRFERLIFEFDITRPNFNISKLVKCSQEGIIVLVFGYPDISITNKVNEIIKYYDEDDLTYLESIKDIKKFASTYVKESKKIKKLCEQNNIMFIDTSNNREEVLNELFLNIKNKIEEE